MSLFNNILLDIQRKIIPQVFKSSDLKTIPDSDDEFLIGNARYKLTTINTALANLAIDASSGEEGNHVKKGAEPRFKRIAPGTYQLLCSNSVQNADVNNEELDDVNDVEQQAYNRNICDLVEYQNDPVELIAQYLKHVPYQLYFKKRIRRRK